MTKLTINLLQPELIPKQPLITLTKVVAFWLFLFALMLVWSIWSQITADRLTQDVSLLKQQQEQLVSQQQILEQQVANNKADPLLLEQLATLKLLLNNKEALHKQLTDSSSVRASGFSQAMSELAQLHSNDISLERITMSGDLYRFSGVAKEPASVPQWLAGFESSTFLSGQTFGHLSLKENENNHTEFVVSTDKSNKESDK
ncbi:PilN domain-containing protein [Thalassotalea marina]|uniref:MSHA biogenesis protein MshI n=1 Tax=Thalassotalea marina TaxID=1673741 RepID=A0A919EI48_9GAMM|nr:PilN domain-containing protein [Thalassotalea marina]GHF82749.1 hypothetical protein GCM10017161_07470 [Thalassotalea marina]